VVTSIQATVNPVESPKACIVRSGVFEVVDEVVPATSPIQPYRHDSVGYNDERDGDRDEIPEAPPHDQFVKNVKPIHCDNAHDYSFEVVFSDRRVVCSFRPHIVALALVGS